MKELVVLSLFDGMSCGQIALNKLGFKNYKYYASEIKPHAIKCTQHNYPNTIQIGDVTKVSYKDGILFTENGEFEVGEIDLFIGGSPCQNFSVICNTEHRKGLEGEKSKLFYEYDRIRKECNPKHFLLENVSSMKDSDKDILTSIMGVEPIFVNSVSVSGAIRKRYYWTNLAKEIKIQDKNVKFQDVLEYGYTPKDKAVCLLEGHSRPTVTPYRMMQRHYKSFSNYVFRDKEHYENCISFFNDNFKGKDAKERDLFALNNDVSVFDGIRNLTALEMERLQTVPEGYCSNVLNTNDSASLLGDGWTVDVIVEFFRPLTNVYKL